MTDTCGNNPEISLLYYSYGISISGGYKEYLYQPNLKDKIIENNELVAKDPESEKFYVERITNKETGKVIRELESSSIDLYRPIKGFWYIHWSHDY